MIATMTTAPVLRVQGLVKRFGGIVATDHVNLDLHAGEIHALIGPNGAGKTTLVHQLAGSLAPSSGTVSLWGRDITQMPVHERVRMGIARSHQITSLFAHNTVFQNVMFAVMARHGTSFRFFGSPYEEEALRAEALTTIEVVGLAHRVSAIAGSLSHGEQRRVELALALATQPKVLLLDEPMAGMGASDTQAMVELIDQLRQQAAIVLVEHDMDAVFRLANRITVLTYGKVVATDTPEAIRNSPAVREAYLGNEVIA